MAVYGRVTSLPAVVLAVLLRLISATALLVLLDLTVYQVAVVAAVLAALEITGVLLQAEMGA